MLSGHAFCAALDADLLALWQAANGKTLQELLEAGAPWPNQPLLLRAGLACLAEAGLLLRSTPVPAPPAPCPIPRDAPLISVVIVSYNSRNWLETCLPSLAAQTYPALEVIVVDNGSQDDTLAWLRAHHPQHLLVALPGGSLAAAMNAGTRAARGEYILQLNPDVTLAPDAVAELAAVLAADPQAATAAAKLRFMWSPAFLNGLGNWVGDTAWGMDNAIGHLDLGQFDGWQEVPSACFAAALLRREALQAVGEMDAGFPMYYEDSEWCYRARLLGWKVLAAPRAVVYHAFGGSDPQGRPEELSPAKLRNVAYGRLRFMMKIVGAPALRRFTRHYLREDLINSCRELLKFKLKHALAYPAGWLRLLRDRRELKLSRAAVQARRRLPDDLLFQWHLPPHHIWQGLPELTADLIRNEYLPLIRSGRTRPMPEFSRSHARPHLLIVSQDVVDHKMAGPGMRYLEMARALADDLQVTLAVPADTSLQVPGLQLVRYWEDRPESLQILVENADIALISGYMVVKFPFLLTTVTPLVVDLYDPLLLENLHYYLEEPLQKQDALNQQAVEMTNLCARIGDYFICGNQRQRDLWMGVLMSNGRINPHTFVQDPTLYSLLDVVGVGFPNRDLQARPFIKGVHPQVPADARVVLWGGGVWNWLDPLTLVRAWPQVIAAHPEARLVFLGTRHPNPNVPEHGMAQKTIDLAAEIGEKDKTILFFDWLAYEDREALLCEADIGVTMHPVHVETRYSIRTRVLDYLWARLPVLITDGDVTSEWVKTYGIGRVVPPFDVQAAAEALNELLALPKGALHAAFDPLHEQMNWKRVVEPLKRYCLAGVRAADWGTRPAAATAPLPPATDSLAGKFAKAGYILRQQGPGAMLRQAWTHLKWMLGKRA